MKSHPKYPFFLPVLFLASLAAFLGGVPAALGQPTLGIAQTGNQSVLFWPTTQSNYIVLAATNVNSSNWVYASDAVPVTAVTVSNTSPARFFQLHLYTPPAGMVFIPDGWFTIGDTQDGGLSTTYAYDAFPTNVYLSAFNMETNLVTDSLWKSIYSLATNSAYGYGFDYTGEISPPEQPVYSADWYDAVKWCNARSQEAGLTPVYYTDSGLSVIYKTGDVDAVYANWSANGYRLPTEAEWEKAARGGLSGLRFPWGNTISESQAIYFGDTNMFGYDLGPNGQNPTTGSQLGNVGLFPPNGYGLFDMAGNADEWCWDWYAGTPYPAGSPYLGGNNPRGPASGSSGRVLRGGDYGDYADYCRCANRNYRPPNIEPIGIYSFRCVRGVTFP
jgi:formylglycine-generating enzyme required for sulfatase activity